jgi:hypothetical protein
VDKAAGEATDMVSRRVKMLEDLLREQKEFIDQTASMWSDLLQNERSRTQLSETLRGEMETQLRASDEALTMREKEISEALAQAKTSSDAHSALSRQHTLLENEFALVEDRLAEQLSIVDSFQKQLDRQKGETAHLREDNSELRQQAAKADIRLEASRGEARKLETDLAKLENILRQRQEEIDQTLAKLANQQGTVAELEADLEQARARGEKLERKLTEANGWVLKLAEQRAGREKELEAITIDRDRKAQELSANASQVKELRERIKRLTERNAELEKKEEIASGETSTKMDSGPKSPIPSALPPITVTSVAPPIPLVPQPVVLPVAVSDTCLLQPVQNRDKAQLLRQLSGAASLSSAQTFAIAETVAEQSPGLVNLKAPDPLVSSDLVKSAGQFAEQQEPLPAANAASPQPEAQPVAKPTSTTTTRQPMPMVVTPRGREDERRLIEAREHAEWLREVTMATMETPNKWWWRFMSPTWRQERERRKLKQRGLFDGDAYLERYPDVAEAGMDPLQHYLEHGVKEHRQR